MAMSFGRAEIGKRSRKIGLLLLFVSVLLAGGCGDDRGLRAVSGTVTVKGKPVEMGMIQFIPAASPAAGTPHTQSGAMIADGKYEIPKQKGLFPGKYKVSVYSYDTKGAKVPSPEIPGESSAVQFKERIPTKYNGPQTTLTAEVTAGGSNVFDFTLD